MIALMYCFASKAAIQLYIHMCGHIAVCFQVVNCKMSPICKRWNVCSPLQYSRCK